MSSVSPLVKKGALLVYEPNTGIPLSTIAFQYNPETLRRSLQPQGVGDQPDRTEVLRLKGPAIETIHCDIEIDATDLLEQQDATTLAYGVAPQLSTLELLVYPSSSVLIANEVLSLVGTIEILPMSSNLTVLALGPNRVAPVRLTSIEITEEQFDPQLNPIRAKVSLAMRVLNVNDVGFLTPAGAMYMAYQMSKESIASA
ncbi:MAG TPA: hypothetical protein VK446_16245 [Methylocystis sp.]|nr:hypothetical protein [Methylocystis sp.]